MKNKLPIIIGTIAAIIVLVGGVLLTQHFQSIPNPADHVYAASEETGNIPEKVIGDPDTAKVVIYEYADYACSHCAEWNTEVNNLLEKYPDQIALVFRSANVGFSNGMVGAYAATAAQLQGYWKTYKDLLFSSQAEWFYMQGDELTNQLVEYFRIVSHDEGDLDQFRADMQSEAVSQRLEFDEKMGYDIDLKGTPTFRIDGRTIIASKLIETVETKLQQGE